jgi:hypothetical protein
MRIARLIKLAWVVVGLAVIAGTQMSCMTVSDKQTVVSNTNGSRSFANRKIAVLPVKAQSSLAPDSVTSLRNAVNQKLGSALREKAPTATVIDIPTIVDQLNARNALATFEQLIATYESTGVIDKQKTSALGRALNCEFLLLSRLKAEKMDLSFLGKGTGGSLDVFIVGAQTGEVAWAGSGEWKKGGILGFGGATADEAAKGLVGLAFAGL